MKKTIAILLFLIFPLALFAHPHTFMDARIVVLTDSTHVIGFDIEWRFDFISSWDFYYESDYDKDGKFNAEELKDLQIYAFQNLKNYHYFTNIFHNGKKFEPTTYSHFRAFFDQKTELLTYKFRIPYKATIAQINSLSIGVWDESFFCDIAFFETKPWQIIGDGSNLLIGNLKKSDQYKVQYDNEVINSQRAGAVYTGTFIPSLLTLTRS